MSDTVIATTTDGREIELNISDEICMEYGGLIRDDIVLSPHGEVLIKGVGLNKRGENVLFYEILHKKTKGKVCCFEKTGKLLELGFIYQKHLSKEQII